MGHAKTLRFRHTAVCPGCTVVSGVLFKCRVRYFDVEYAVLVVRRIHY